MYKIKGGLLLSTQKTLLSHPSTCGLKVLSNATPATRPPIYPIRLIFQSNSKKEYESWSPSEAEDGENEGPA